MIIPDGRLAIYKCRKCGMYFVNYYNSDVELKIGDELKHECGGMGEVIKCLDFMQSMLFFSIYEQERKHIMTDKEIGKTAREIAERGNTAEVKRNKDGIVILEVEKNIVKSDKRQ